MLTVLFPSSQKSGAGRQYAFPRIAARKPPNFRRAILVFAGDLASKMNIDDHFIESLCKNAMIAATERVVSRTGRHKRDIFVKPLKSHLNSSSSGMRDVAFFATLASKSTISAKTALGSNSRAIRPNPRHSASPASAL
jgi:hypothetical protein